MAPLLAITTLFKLQTSASVRASVAPRQEADQRRLHRLPERRQEFHHQHAAGEEGLQGGADRWRDEGTTPTAAATSALTNAALVHESYIKLQSTRDRLRSLHLIRLRSVLFGLVRFRSISFDFVQFHLI